ncbi:MAG: metallophosphoesterase [Oscillospiraceae bacterium]|nr:metallophosphoesterase [Oscillospiraceae bacterium]
MSLRRIRKLLAVSDVESPYIWDYFDPDVFGGVDMILSCGDLSGEYLDYLVTMIPAPLFFVPGNHDKRFLESPPDGCTSLDGRALTYRGVRLAGLGGCKSGRQSAYEYSEKGMSRRVDVLSRQIRRQGRLDIFLSHVSARGWGDSEDTYHRGFQCFTGFLDEFKPRYHFFGHTHMAYGRHAIPKAYGSTRLVNACGYRLIEYG